MSFFQSTRKTQIEMPLGAERQDLLADIARRAGERKQQVQALLEEYAREKDEAPAPPVLASPLEVSFRGVLQEIHPPAAAERRWITRAAEPDPEEKIAALEARIKNLESGQEALVGIVDQLTQFIARLKAPVKRFSPERLDAGRS